jgi:hypothetical protein
MSTMPASSSDRPQFTIVVRDVGEQGSRDRRLRAALKYLLRFFGLRAVSIKAAGGGE